MLKADKMRSPDKMMATVDKIEEEDGVITVYFSSPYEVSTPYQVELDTGAAVYNEPSHRPVYTSAGPCLVSRKPKKKSKPSRDPDCFSLPRLPSRRGRGGSPLLPSRQRKGSRGGKRGRGGLRRSQSVQILEDGGDIQWEYDPAPSLETITSPRSQSRNLVNPTPEPGLVALRPETSHSIHARKCSNLVRNEAKRPETSPMVPNDSLGKRLNCDHLLISEKKKGVGSGPPDLISTEFSQAEWNISNINNYKKADVIRQKSEAVRNITNQLIEEHDDYARKGAVQARYRLGERMKDVSFWREEIKQEIKILREVTESLRDGQRNVDHALAQTDRPYRIYNKCKEFREKRLGIEMVKDTVELSLQTEHEIIRHHQETLKEILQECVMQVDRNSEMIQRLSSDLNNKDQAISIDKATASLSIQAKGPTPSLKNKEKNKNKDKVEGPPRTEVPNRKTRQWAKDSQESIQLSQNVRSATSKLTAQTEAACNQAITEIKSAWVGTSQALANRVKELSSTQAKVQDHLDKTLKEIKDQENHIEHLKSSLKAKQNPLSLAKARLAMRARLPEEEACLDLPYIALLEEVGQLQGSMDTLNRALSQAQVSHHELYGVKQSLEHDLFLKCNSIEIDRSKCMPLRAEFPFHLWCGCNKCKSCRTSLYCRTHTCKKV